MSNGGDRSRRRSSVPIPFDEACIEADPAYPKFVKLRGILGGKSALVSFSGGVDSTLLAFVARWFCARSLAVVAALPTLGPGELDDATRVASLIGIPHRVIECDVLQNPKFAGNPRDRCYHCKRSLLGAMVGFAAIEGYDTVLEGTNASDMGDDRPGRRAVIELKVRSPLLEAGLTKPEVRRLSKALGLPTWDKPSMACLASRIPYGSPITRERLARIGGAESFVRALGFDVVRVRDHDGLARIEVENDRIKDLCTPTISSSIVTKLRSLGFVQVCVDLLGYRTGSMNEGEHTPKSRARRLAR